MFKLAATELKIGQNSPIHTLKLKFEAVVEIRITDEPIKLENGHQQIQMAAIGLSIRYCTPQMKHITKYHHGLFARICSNLAWFNLLIKFFSSFKAINFCYLNGKVPA